MPYRLIAMDLDDTLLNDELAVSPGNRRALEEAAARGVHITIATGRMFDSARKVARQIGLNVPIITYQGSLIKNLLDEEVLYERTVSADIAREVYAYCLERGLHLQTYIEDVLYVSEDSAKIRDYVRLTNVPYTVAPDFRALMDEDRHTKLLIIDDPDTLDAMMPELRERFGGKVHLTKSKPHYLEFLHKEGTKGHALRFLAGHYGIPIEQTIAMGDAMNDHEMVAAAGLGVAMANAVPALKEIANYVTLSNNDDGVRHVIEKFVLNT